MPHDVHIHSSVYRCTQTIEITTEENNYRATGYVLRWLDVGESRVDVSMMKNYFLLFPFVIISICKSLKKLVETIFDFLMPYYESKKFPKLNNWTVDPNHFAALLLLYNFQFFQEIFLGIFLGKE